MTSNDRAYPHICILAGEPSGDALGGPLIEALTAKGACIGGVGGPHMQKHGLQSLFPMEDLSVMGLIEILPRLPLLLKRIRQSVDYIVDTKPDCVVTIDSPDFGLRVMRKVRQRLGRSIKHIHYVAPTVWAWRAGRAAKLAQLADGLMCLFPFEPDYFKPHGLDAVFTGHPVMNSPFPAKGRINPQMSPRIGLLFGSRTGEVKRLSPVLLAAMHEILRHRPEASFVAPTLTHLKPYIEALCSSLPVTVTVPETRAQQADLFHSMDAAIAVSGTVGLELSVSGVPHVIGYTMNPLTAAIIRRVIKTPYAHLTNIMLQKPVVPEFIQEHCTPEAISQAILALLQNTDKRKTQLEATGNIHTLLSDKVEIAPADFVLSYC